MKSKQNEKQIISFSLYLESDMNYGHIFSSIDIYGHITCIMHCKADIPFCGWNMPPGIPKLNQKQTKKCGTPET